MAHDSYVGHEPTAATLVSWFGVLLSTLQSFGNVFLLGKDKVKDMQICNIHNRNDLMFYACSVTFVLKNRSSKAANLNS